MCNKILTDQIYDSVNLLYSSLQLNTTFGLLQLRPENICACVSGVYLLFTELNTYSLTLKYTGMTVFILTISYRQTFLTSRNTRPKDEEPQAPRTRRVERGRQ